MRELTKQEEEAKLKAWMEYGYSGKHSGMIAELWAFDGGFTAGLDYTAAQIAALEGKRELLLREVVKLRARVDALEWVLGPFARVGRILATFAPVLKPEVILWHQDNYDITVGDCLSARRVMDDDEARRALTN